MCVCVSDRSASFIISWTGNETCASVCQRSTNTHQLSLWSSDIIVDISPSLHLSHPSCRLSLLPFSHCHRSIYIPSLQSIFHLCGSLPPPSVTINQYHYYSSLFHLSLFTSTGWRRRGWSGVPAGGFGGFVCLSNMLSSVFDKNPVSADFICHHTHTQTHRTHTLLLINFIIHTCVCGACERNRGGVSRFSCNLTRSEMSYLFDLLNNL